MAPGPASAAAPPGFVGVQSYSKLFMPDHTRLYNARIGVQRQNVAWREVEARRGHYDWRRYDWQFEHASNAGIRVMPVLVGSPAWASDDVHHPPLTSEGRLAYYRFVHAVVKRYGPEGSFWGTRPGLIRPRLFQIWNEPNLPNWWNDDPDPAEYARLLKGAAQAVRTASPSAEVVAAGLPESRNSRVMTIRSFLRGLYRVPGARDAFDYLALHPYSKTPEGVLDLVRRARVAMRDGGDRAKKVWITEFGWSVSGGHSDFSVSPDVQAAYLKQTYRALISNRTRLGISGAIWFLYRDPPPEGPDLGRWQNRTGLFTSRDNPRPSWRALVEVTGGRR